jgi:hypothetical protein
MVDASCLTFAMYFLERGGVWHAHVHAHLLHLRRYVAGVRQYQRAPVSQRPPTTPPHHRTPFIFSCSPRRHHRHLASCVLTANLLCSFTCSRPALCQNVFSTDLSSGHSITKCVTVQKMLPTHACCNACCTARWRAVQLVMIRTSCVERTAGTRIRLTVLFRACMLDYRQLGDIIFS